MLLMSEAETHKKFLRLFSKHSRGLYSYILTLMLNQADADEVFQESSTVLWEKFETFREGTNFFAWACRIAYFEVQVYRRRQANRQRWLSDQAVETMAETIGGMIDELDARQQALEDCLHRLRKSDREMVDQRYRQGMSVKEMAAGLGRSVHAIYRSLERIHNALFVCIERKLAEEA